MELIKYLIYGYLIILVAILFNIGAKVVGLKTWYDYLGEISKLGLAPATLSLHPLDLLFLFLIYPSLFGLLVYLFKR